MDRECIGPYRLLRLLGKGGMGAVYEAVHQTIERRAAIKILHQQFASQKEYAERFLNEALAANRIGHPSIVEIYDLGSLPDGTTYLVMEFLDGETLGKRLQRHGGTLPLLDLLWIGHEIAGAVGSAHKKGIIHRDLKPDNIMLVSDAAVPRGERVKLLDFGIAKLSAGNMQDRAATQVGTVMGTPSYMPPEQLRDTSHVSDRADVYALGALLYHLASGRPPFVATSDIDLMAMHLRDEVLPVREVAPETPEPLAKLIGHMLAKDHLQRPAMVEVEGDLLRLLRMLGGTASGQLPSVAPPRPHGAVPETMVRKTPAAAGPPSSAPHATPPAVSEEAPIGVPSASTLSRSASEAAARVVSGRQRRRALLLAVASGISALAVVLAMTRHHQAAVPNPPVATVDSAPASGPHAAAPPAAVQSVPLVAPTTPPPVPAPPTVVPPTVRGCQRTTIGASCISTPRDKTSPAVLEAAIRAAKTAGLKLCMGQRVRAIREGTQMHFSPARVLSADDAKLFSDTFRGRLLTGGIELPSEVVFKCDK